MSEEKKSKWDSIVEGLEAKDYVRVIVLAAFGIVGVIWFAFRGDNEAKDAKIQELNQQLITQERNINRFWQRREDSISLAHRNEVGEWKTALKDFTDEVNEDLRSRVEESDKKSAEELKLLRKYRSNQGKSHQQALKSDSVTKQLLNLGNQ